MTAETTGLYLLAVSGVLLALSIPAGLYCRYVLAMSRPPRWLWLCSLMALACSFGSMMMALVVIGG